MTAENITEGARRDILNQTIIPLYFPASAHTAPPTLTLLAGQPGSGKSRATGLLLNGSSDEVAVVVGYDLRAFHPRFTELTRAGSAEESQVLGRATAEWVAGCLRYARENHRSLLLEGTFHDPTVAAKTAARFAAEGYQSRVVVAGARRAESLLSVVSRYLSDVRAGRATHYTSREVHDRGLHDTRVLVASLEHTPFVDRLTVLARNGATAFDANAGDDDTFRGAAAALELVQSRRMSAMESAQWLSELHWMTHFAVSRRDLPRAVVESLIDLHETALREVIPELPVPVRGRSAVLMEQRSVTALVGLGEVVATARLTDPTAPAFTPGAPERGIAR